MISLDVIEVVQVVDHYPERLAQAVARQICADVDAFDTGAIAKVKSRDRVGRLSARIPGEQEIDGRRARQHARLDVGSGIGRIKQSQQAVAEFARDVARLVSLQFCRQPRCKARCGRQRHERFQTRQLALEVLHHLLDQKVAERDTGQPFLRVGDRIEHRGIRQENPADPRKIWHIFAQHYYLFRGTPTRTWLDYAFEKLFDLEEPLTAVNADHYFDTIAEKLTQPEFRPRALYERFRIEVLATTDSPLDSLADHRAILESGWKGRIVPTFRPDSVVDPAFDGFRGNITKLGELTGEDTTNWTGYLQALRKTRERFKSLGCTATDHGHPTANTANLSTAEAEKLFAAVIEGKATSEEQELFRAQMLTEMARMSIADGLVMQLHPGSFRNHNRKIFERYGRDSGADIPSSHRLCPALQAAARSPRQ